jgi:ABC-type multidrug transport system fused ATPase/permease subunit
MDDGAVTESGTHEELLDRGGEYASLWRAQADEGPPQAADG